MSAPAQLAADASSRAPGRLPLIVPKDEDVDGGMLLLAEAALTEIPERDREAAAVEAARGGS
ncbi:MAG TPA: hypothetical protein VLD67_05925, partial [Vicinamibacterales bacterium]|nr:hypothetical protein [Vicinamibacterales bacterium]